MNDGFGVRQTLVEIFDGLVRFVADLVPRLVTALVVLAIGVLLAKIVERILRTTFVRLRVDALLEKAGVAQTVRSLGVKGSLGETTARTVYWLLVILFVRGASDSIGLDIVSDAIGSFFGYLPNLVAAFLVVMLGNVVAQFAGGAVRESAADSGVDYAPALGRAVTAAILFIVTIMAITQLGIDTEMIRTVVVIGLAGGALGLALTFGLGSREVTRNILAGFYARRLFRIGDDMEIDGLRGTLVAITSTQCQLEIDGRIVSIPNRRFLEDVVRGPAPDA
jgi:small-conductance mechanosensitive channel